MIYRRSKARHSGPTATSLVVLKEHANAVSEVNSSNSLGREIWDQSRLYAKMRQIKGDLPQQKRVPH